MFLVAVALIAVQCADEEITDSFEVMNKSGKVMPGLKATGSVQVFWESGGQKKETDDGVKTRQAFFQFDAHEEISNRDPKGEIILQVFEDELVLHREIKAIVQDVFIDADENKAWFTGIVYYDSKSLEDEHSDHDDGGCSHDDGEECSHEDGEDEAGGCDGGCTDDEGGCSHDDGEEGDDGCTHDDEESCEGGSGGSSGKLSGKLPRVGQIIAVKVHDGGTPGAGNDGITWRWYSSEGAFVPDAGNHSDWPHLCKKTIVEGNLIVHSK